MKRALNNLVKSRCYFAAWSVGVFFLLAGVGTAQSSQPPVAKQKLDVSGAAAETSDQQKMPLPNALSLMPDVHAELEVVHRRSQSLATHSPIARIAISAPKVIDVEQDLKELQKITILALRPGKSLLTLWVENSRDPVIYLVEVLPDSPVIQASGVQQSLPHVAPKSEVQQVLDEVREIRKLIQGLRDDMSRLRESVTQPERPVSKTEIWIQEDGSQVFARGKKIRSVVTDDPLLVEIAVLAPDRLRLTGKKAGRTTLRCLFEGEATPTTFMVEVIPESKHAVGQSSVLMPRAAAHLPGERVAQRQRPVQPVTTRSVGAVRRLRIQELHMELIKRDKPIARIAVGASTIVDVAQYSDRECGIIAQKPGSTTVLLWLEGESDPEQFIVEVTPAPRGVTTSMSATGSVREDAARRQIEEALDKQVSIDITEGTLLEALRHLQKTAEVNIAVDLPALESVGVTTKSKVAIVLSGVTLRSALKIMLGELDLAAIIENEVLKVTSRERAEGRQTVIAYRVTDLVQRSDGETGGFDELITLVTTVVQPESWLEVGGNGSVAANLPTGALVIRQTDRAHDEIKQLFIALRSWKQAAIEDSNSPATMGIGVDELDDGRVSGFSPIEYSNPPLGVVTPGSRPISPADRSVPTEDKHPGTTGAPIDLPRKF